MILTDAQYHCLIGIPPRTPDRETIFRCIYNLTNSKGNALIPLSSYGLNVTEEGEIRSICATNAPCLNFNALLAGPLEKIAIECGFLEKLVRMETVTPFFQSSKMGIGAKRVPERHASSKPPAWENKLKTSLP
jgi:hypothetical protein